MIRSVIPRHSASTERAGCTAKTHAVYPVYPVHADRSMRSTRSTRSARCDTNADAGEVLLRCDVNACDRPVVKLVVL